MHEGRFFVLEYKKVEYYQPISWILFEAARQEIGDVFNDQQFGLAHFFLIFFFVVFSVFFYEAYDGSKHKA